MSITDPIFVEYQQRRGTWILRQGRETFYNDDREMIEFPSQIAAKKYCEDVLGKTLGLPVELKPRQGYLI